VTKFSFVLSLTLGRAPLAIAAAGLMVVHAFKPSVALLVAALGCMVCSALTDLFDGLLARKWKVTSRLGALADPLMDKVFYAVTLPVAVFVAAYLEDFNHALLLLALDVVSALRDQWVSFLRTVGSEYGADVKANWSGKLRTLIGFPVVVVAHLQLGLLALQKQSPAHESIKLLPENLVFALEIATIAITIISAGSYTLRYWQYLKRAANR